MKHWIEVMVLFAALCLTGVDAKATAIDEDKTTKASAWVAEWTADTEKILREKGYKCEEATQVAAYEQVHKIIPRIITSVAEPAVSSEDVSVFRDAIYFSKSVAKKEIEFCKDLADHQWTPFLSTLEQLLVYIGK